MKSRHPASAYLGSYVAIKKQIEALENEMSYLREKATYATPNIEKAGHSVRVDAMAALAVRRVDVETRLANMIEHLRECLDMRLWLLDQLDNPMHKLILTYRYINGLSWMEIRQKINYEESAAYEIHGRALDAFWNIYTNGGGAVNEQ